jgi:plastocyanin
MKRLSLLGLLVLLGACEGGAPEPSFMAVAPCDGADAYQTGTTVGFGGDTQPVLSYTPSCLRVARGARVAFVGDFSAHPMWPSTDRGTRPGNPITFTGSGGAASFTFATPGFFPFYCQHHGPTDDGTNMSGVIWVTP